MRPSDKAKQIYDCFFLKLEHQDNYWGAEQQAKECALFSVDLIIESNPHVNVSLDDCLDYLENNIKYWQLVKEEIELIC